jgi:hypothetical protein
MPVFYCKRSASAGCLRSLSPFLSSPLRSSDSRPSTLDHAEAPIGRFATDSQSITPCVGSAGSGEVRFMFMDAVCGSISPLPTVLDDCQTLNDFHEISRARRALE